MCIICREIFSVRSAPKNSMGSQTWYSIGSQAGHFQIHLWVNISKLNSANVNMCLLVAHMSNIWAQIYARHLPSILQAPRLRQTCSIHSWQRTSKYFLNQEPRNKKQPTNHQPPTTTSTNHPLPRTKNQGTRIQHQNRRHYHFENLRGHPPEQVSLQRAS